MMSLDALLVAGVRVNATLPSSRGYNLLHKVLSRDKAALSDVSERLLQPLADPSSAASAQLAHLSYFLTSVADTVAVRFEGGGGLDRVVEKDVRLERPVRDRGVGFGVAGKERGREAGYRADKTEPAGERWQHGRSFWIDGRSTPPPRCCGRAGR